MKKNILVFTVMSIFVVSSLFPGGQKEKGGEASGGKPVTLTVWGDSFFTPKWQGRQGPVLDEIWRSFEEEYNVKLDLQLVPYPDFQAKLLTAINAGNAPDVAIADQYWLASLVATGGVEDISEYWPAEDRMDFFDWSVDGVTVNGKIYGIWYSTDARLLYYRKDLISSPPETWDEMYSMSKKLTNSDQYGNGMVFSGEGGMINILVDYWSLGGKLVDSNANPIFNQGKNKEILIKIFEYYKKYYDEGLVPKDSISYGSENDMNPRIFSGGHAMFHGGTWQIGSILDNMDPQDAKNWDVAPRPVPAGGKPISVAGGFALNVFTSDPEKKEKAVEFIKYLSNPVNGAKFAAASSGLPVRRSVYENDSYFSTDKFMKKFGSVLEQASTRPTTLMYPIISDSISHALTEYLSGNKTVVQAIADAEKSVIAKQ